MARPTTTTNYNRKQGQVRVVDQCQPRRGSSDQQPHLWAMLLPRHDRVARQEVANCPIPPSFPYRSLYSAYAKAFFLGRNGIDLFSRFARAQLDRPARTALNTRFARVQQDCPLPSIHAWLECNEQDCHTALNTRFARVQLDRPSRITLSTRFARVQPARLPHCPQQTSVRRY